MNDQARAEGGFTLIEVAIASVIMMFGLVFLAGLFTLAISQNRLVRQFTSTTALAQEKMEELNAIENNDARLSPGGNLNTGQSITVSGKQIDYYDAIYFDEKTGRVTTTIPQGQVPHYNRFWSIQNDPQLDNTLIITVRVVALQPGRNRGEIGRAHV